MALTRDEYHALRRKFEPQYIRLVIIAESPPKTGKYLAGSKMKCTSVEHSLEAQNGQGIQAIGD